jgi:dihydroorotate dehydrogenase electron transfer subunit
MVMSEFMNTFPITKIVTHSPGLRSLYFEVPFGGQCNPGQFINLWIPGVDEKPFSVSAVYGDTIELSVKEVGTFTCRLMKCSEGDYLGVRGPFGSDFVIKDGALLIGGGIGVAPLRFLAMRMEKLAIDHAVVVGAHTKNDIIFPDWFEEIGATIVTEDGSAGESGLATDCFERMLAEKEICCVFGSGPEDMLIALKQKAEEHNLDYQLSLERYIKCGIGICGSCCMEDSGLRICVEGPVLGPDELQDFGKRIESEK